MSLIFIVEDDENIGEIEELTLKNSGYETRRFGTAQLFWEALSEEAPALLLLDIMLPDADGLDVLRKLRRNPLYTKLPVIMVTAKAAEIDKVKGLDIGADDYMTKPFGVMEFVSRVKALLRRTEEEHTAKVCCIGELCLDDEKRIVTAKGRECELTFKEYELLKFLMLNAGSVLSREAIIQNVWGVDFVGESRTIDMHIKSLRHKLVDAGEYIKTVRNVGYVLDIRA